MEIVIPENGYGIGTFQSAATDLTNATVQPGETFAPAIFVAAQNQKSVWYKFTLPTSRKVSVALAQQGTAITAGDAGFTVYKSNNCLPGNSELSTQLTPIITFGNSFHPCVSPGEYLVQVSSKLAANGPVYVVITTDDADAEYDHPGNAYEFGTLTTWTQHVDYWVECQSLDNNDEICNGLGTPQQYNKSTWHTFTTPTYFDYIAVMFSGTYYWNNSGDKVIGYKLYEGNAVNNFNGLTLIDGCDSFISNGYNADYRRYGCGVLNPNTTYTVQLFFDTAFHEESVRLAIAYEGTDSTQAPFPVLSLMPASNQLGVLPPNTSVTGTDHFACNSRHFLHPCGDALPDTGFVFNNLHYNLSTFYTFEISSISNLTIGSDVGCYDNALISLYQGNLNENCSTPSNGNLLARSINNLYYYCLEPGSYTIQFSGRDTFQVSTSYLFKHYGNLGGNSRQCLFGNLGNQLQISVLAQPVQIGNAFSLFEGGAFDNINNMQPLAWDTEFQTQPDTFGCDFTLLPEGASTCITFPPARAMFREFSVGDSGVVHFSNLNNYSDSYWGTSVYYQLYSGDANALAGTQGVNAYPEIISGLSAYAPCMTQVQCSGSNNVCLEPGTYTFATIGNAAEQLVGWGNQPSVQFENVVTQHYNQATVQDMGSVIDSVGGESGSILSDVDWFSCKDNAVAIDGNAPCNNATKAIYRQFYLNQPAVIEIERASSTCNDANGVMSLYSGQMSAVGIAGLTTVWPCFGNSGSTDPCETLPAGWYTVVDFATGPTYGDNFQGNSNGSGGNVNKRSQFSINITVDCDGPKYNRPYKAATDNGNPFLVEWNVAADTGAYPVTSNLVQLPEENFNCTVDTPFSLHPVEPCDIASSRVAYYVFELTQESFIQINTGYHWSKVYPFDVRTDSTLMMSTDPVQPCINTSYHIEICKAQPGIYTLVLFANGNDRCTSVNPSIYIDKVGTSRFDFASNAYDFGLIPGDSVYHYGAVGDINPLDPNRMPSNDFFYCTTGAAPSDPTNGACGVNYNPEIYNTDLNNNLYTQDIPAGWNEYFSSRRNLWYTFVADQPGWVHVKVENKTLGGTNLNFAVYKSDVNGTLPFSTVVSSGQVDSTIDQGLEFIAKNAQTTYCFGPEEISFYRDPCNSAPAERYYIVVDNRGYNASGNPQIMIPNRQVEVSILLDTVNAVGALYDHYSNAYNFGTVGIGTYSGGEDNFTCASVDPTDPVYNFSTYAQRTLWYKFTIDEGLSGHVNYRMRLDSANYFYGPENIQLFKQLIPGDSTSNGLHYLPYSSTYFGEGSNWSSNCIAPGTYYLIITGYNRLSEDVYPEIMIIQDEGDYCSSPVPAFLSGTGTSTANVIIDCHTIGTDYGEFGPELTCPEGGLTADYKSSWFRIDVTGTDTLDVTTYLTEDVDNIYPEQIKYRMMTGDCNAMQEQSCVLDALTQNTYKCLAPGISYYIQVFTPATYGGDNNSTGSITLNLDAVIHQDTCAPVNNCMATANFIPQFDCNQSDSVQMINYSTYGSAITYLWDFGYNGQTSQAVSPMFYYPELATDATYTITLTVTNTNCGASSTATQSVTIPGRPQLNLGNDTVICNAGTTITLDATTFEGAMYVWQDGSTEPTFTISTSGSTQAAVTVSYNGCTKTDTIHVYITPMEPSVHDVILCYVDSIELNATFPGATYQWNDGSTNSIIWAYEQNTFWVAKSLDGCTITDSFYVSAASLIDPLGNDTAICMPVALVLDATIDGASGYTWQDGNSSSQYEVTSPGVYSVQLTINGCQIFDTIEISGINPQTTSISQIICFGDNFQGYTQTGTYVDTFSGANGCDSIQILELTVNETVSTTLNQSICEGSSYLGYTTSGTYIDTVINSNGCDSIITLNLTVNPTLTAATTMVKCDNEMPFIWNGQSISTAGTGIATFTTASLITGCDSITTLNVIINPTVTSELYDTVCSNQTPYDFNGQSLSSGGTYYDTLQTVLGCDSAITLFLTINPVMQSEVFDTICSGQSYTLPSGITVSEGGTYTSTFVAQLSGCDSIVTTQLFMNPIITQTVSITICPDELPYFWNGLTIGAGGSAVATFTTPSLVTGCDSITLLNLIVNPDIEVSVTLTHCADELPFQWNGQTIASGGNNVATFTTASLVTGCDSTTILNVIVNPVVSTTVTDTVCDNQLPYFFNGQLLTTNGTYFDTLETIAGCDSFITLILVVNPVTTASLFDTVCASQLPYDFNGILLNASGAYFDTFLNAYGCDSIVSLQLNVKPLTFDTLFVEICEGTSYNYGGNEYTISGDYAFTFTGNNGCDSIFTLSLIVHPLPPPPQVNSPVIYCEGSPALPLTANGSNLLWYTTPTGGTGSPIAPIPSTDLPGIVVYYVSQTVNGCEGARDSILVEVREIPEASFDIVPPEACALEIFTLTFTGNAPQGSTFNWNWDGAEIVTGTDPGPYTLMWTDAGNKIITLWLDNGGCASDTAFGAVVVKPIPDTPVINMPEYVCIYDLVVISGTGDEEGAFYWDIDGNLLSGSTVISTTWETPGDKIVSLYVEKDGCKSATVYDTIKVIPLPDATITLNHQDEICLNDTVTLSGVAGEGYSYIWTPDVYFRESADTGRVVVARVVYSGIIYLNVTDGYGCTSNDSIMLNGVHCCTVLIPNAFSPNGDGVNDNFGLVTEAAQVINQFAIYNRWGERVFISFAPFETWDGTYKGKPAEAGTYFYYLKYTCSNGEEFIKKGDLLLIR